MLASERRELMLKTLRDTFPGREFCVADILKRTTQPDMSIALTANFAQGWGKLPVPVIGIKIGRFLEGKLLGKRSDGLQLFSLGKRADVNYYRIGPPSPPKVVPFLVIEHVDGDGHLHQTILKDSHGEPLRDKSADAPVADKPVEPPAVQQTGPPPKWRQPTKQELAARHHQSTGPSYGQNHWSTHGSITPSRGNFNL